MALISENERQNTAFAFLDEGSYGERGLEVLRDSAKRKATIYYLDSVGAKAPLHVVGTEFDRKQLARLGNPSRRRNPCNNQLCDQRK